MYKEHKKNLEGINTNKESDLHLASILEKDLRTKIKDHEKSIQENINHIAQGDDARNKLK